MGNKKLKKKKKNADKKTTTLFPRLVSFVLGLFFIVTASMFTLPFNTVAMVENQENLSDVSGSDIIDWS